MNTNLPSLMDTALTGFQESGKDAALYLKNGIKLTGKIVKFDNTSILMSADDSEGITIDRTAVSSVQKVGLNPKHSGSYKPNGFDVKSL